MGEHVIISPNRNPSEAARQLTEGKRQEGYRAKSMHKYTDRDGKPLFWRLHMINSETGDDWIGAMRKTDLGYSLDEPEFPAGTPLYRLHDLVTRSKEPVILCENEWSVDKLIQIGVLATTSGGSDSIQCADLSPLRERSVTAWPNNHPAGQRFAFAASTALRLLGCVPRTIHTRAPGMRELFEPADWLAANPSATPQDVFALSCLDELRKTTIRKTPCKEPAAGLVCGADITPESVTWLWHGWLAEGALHIMAGVPGVGKTTVALAFAAVISAGGYWPDGSHTEAADVLIWSGEDAIETTLVPRLKANGADMKRVHFVKTAQGKEGERPFDPAIDIQQLRAAIRDNKLQTKLVIIDSVVSAVATDSHKNSETRRSLQPLVELAEAEKCAVLGITHFTKGTGERLPIDRVTGSLAFGALPRVVMAVAKTSEGQGAGRLLVCVKNNLGPDDGAYRFELRDERLFDSPDITASSVVWGEKVEGDARSILAQAEGLVGKKKSTLTGEAAVWLKELLAESSMATSEVRRLAEVAGFEWRTVQRAMGMAGVVSKHDGFGGVHYWSIPPCVPSRGMHADPQEVAHMGNVGAHDGVRLTVTEPH
jgi:putative DNA primase/helicase